MESSYALSPQQIETVLEAEFAADALAERLSGDDRRIYVAEAEIDDETEVNGFVDVATTDGTEIRWLHVDPEARGAGIGTALVEHVETELLEAGADLTAVVLEDAVEGRDFFEQFGFTEAGTEWVEFDGEELSATILSTAEDTESETPSEPSVEVPETAAVGDETYAVDRESPIPARDAPFFPLRAEGAEADESDGTDGEESESSTPDAEGYFCSSCGSTNVTADGLERLECGDCGNRHRADEWDAAYL